MKCMFSGTPKVVDSVSLKWSLWMHAKSLQSCLTLWTIAHQTPLSVGFPRQEYWSGLLCPLLLPSIFPSIRDFSNESSVRIRWPKYWSFSISPSSEYSGLISRNWLVWPPCCPRDFQESPPTQQLEGIDFLELCFLYRPALTTIRDHWEDHRLDFVDLCWQSNVSAFQHTV